MTWDEYNALTEEEKMDGTVRYIDGDPIPIGGTVIDVMPITEGFSVPYTIEETEGE